jgi:hypothetical protein
MIDNQRQLGKMEAIAFAEEGEWEPMTFRERAEFQINQDLLCMPFSKFHEAVEMTIGRPVFTHEFAYPDHLRKEIFGG